MLVYWRSEPYLLEAGLSLLLCAPVRGLKVLRQCHQSLMAQEQQMLLENLDVGVSRQSCYENGLFGPDNRLIDSGEEVELGYLLGECCQIVVADART